MKHALRCKEVQRWLLASENPSRPADEVQAHFDACQACRSWQRRLVQAERQVRLIPIPASAVPDSLLERVLMAPVGVERRASTIPERGSRIVHRGPRRVLLSVILYPRSSIFRFRRRVANLRASVTRFPAAALAGTAAAAVLLMILTTVALTALSRAPAPQVAKPEPVLPDPLVAKLLEHDLRLAAAKTPGERLKVLADMAGVLHAETQKLARAADAEDLNVLAKEYRRVVRDGVAARARDVPVEQRRDVLRPVAEHLADASRSAERLARMVPKAAEPLHLIASAASDGQGQLHSLLKEARQ